MNPGYYNNGYNNNGGYNNGGYYNNPNGYGNGMMPPPQGMPNRPNVPMNNMNMNRNGNPNQNPNNQPGKPVKPVKPIKNNYNNNKKGNPLLPLIIAAGVLGGIVLILIILIFAGVFAKKEEPAPEPTPTVTDGQVVGTAQHGYITIPNDWVDFVDTNYQDETTVQYSTQDTTYIVTLGYYNDDKTTSRTAAAKLAQNLKNSNCSDLKASDKKKIGEYATYQVSGVYPDGTMLMAFFFETEDGLTRTIMVEGPDANNKAFTVPYSFKLNAAPTNATGDNTQVIQNSSSTNISGDDLGIVDGTATKGDEDLDGLDEQLRSILDSILKIAY